MADGGTGPGNGNGDPLLVRRFVLDPKDVGDPSEPAHRWPAPARHVPAHRAGKRGAHQAGAPETGATEPAAAEQTSDEPTAEPTAAEPTAADRTAAERTMAEPTMAEPTAAEPTAAEPFRIESSSAAPTAIEPNAAGSGATGSDTSESIPVVLPGYPGEHGYPGEPDRPADAQAGDGPSRRRVLLIAGMVVLVAIALAATGIAVINGGDSGRPRLMPASSAPGGRSSAAPPGTIGAAPGGTSPGTTPGVPGQPGGPELGGPGPGASRNGPGSGLATATVEITPTMLAQTAKSSPPAESHTGAIGTDDDRCLALPGGKPLGHMKYAQVTECDGTDGQTWALDADGTMRLGGKCALARDTAVRISGCGHRREAQWRAGPGGILLNVSTGRCLTDEGDAVIAPCTGAPNQRWTLP